MHDPTPDPPEEAEQTGVDSASGEPNRASAVKNILTRDVVLPLRITFQIKDICEIIIGASVLAIPVAYTEEVWKLGEQLPLVNIALIALTSVSVVSLFVYYVYYQTRLSEHFGLFIVRVIACYGITLLCVAFILTLFQKLPWTDDPSVAIRRIILVGFPACFSATVVDSLK